MKLNYMDRQVLTYNHMISWEIKIVFLVNSALIVITPKIICFLNHDICQLECTANFKYKNLLKIYHLLKYFMHLKSKNY